jgi:hypothetical protein
MRSPRVTLVLRVEDARSTMAALAMRLATVRYAGDFRHRNRG